MPQIRPQRPAPGKADPGLESDDPGRPEPDAVPTVSLGAPVELRVALLVTDRFLARALVRELGAAGVAVLDVDDGPVAGLGSFAPDLIVADGRGPSPTPLARAYELRLAGSRGSVGPVPIVALSDATGLVEPDDRGLAAVVPAEGPIDGVLGVVRAIAALSVHLRAG